MGPRELGGIDAGGHPDLDERSTEHGPVLKVGLELYEMVISVVRFLFGIKLPTNRRFENFPFSFHLGASPILADTAISFLKRAESVLFVHTFDWHRRSRSEGSPLFLSSSIEATHHSQP